MLYQPTWNHGTQKMFGFPVPARAPFDLMSMGGASAVLETVGGALLMLGLFSIGGGA